MKYPKITTARFISRPNRFVAIAEHEGQEISVHVKNTGRCKELLVKGAEVYLEDFTGRQGKRKMLYDLVAVNKNGLLINMDSQAPNKAVREALENGTIKLPHMSELAIVKPETVYRDSRFDFYVQDVNGAEGFVEVKGVTLENDGVVSFPDAPTERGVKHINELIKAKSEGYNTYALFAVQMTGAKYFTPNDELHAAFGKALREAVKHGVHVLAYECYISPEEMTVTKPVECRL